MAVNKAHHFKGMPPAVTAFLTFIAATLAAVAIWIIFGDHGMGILKGRMSGMVGLCAYMTIIAVSCFVIVKKHPGSSWYVPVIANLLGIFSAFTEPQFWKDPMIWALMTGGFVLSVIAAAIGARVGKKPGLPTV